MRSKNKKTKKQKEIIFTEKIDKTEVKDNYLDKDEKLLERTLQGLKEESEINPDLENFFDKIREKKDEIDIILINKKEDTLDEINEESTHKKKSTYGNKFKVIILVIVFIESILY